MSEIFDQEKTKGEFNERLTVLFQNSVYGKDGIKQMIAKEKAIAKLESEHRLMKNALYELSRMENNDYATWVIKVLFGGAPHGAK
ncbi:hypothetical protein IM717_18800 [Bacillus velezensis]|uniref:hypothetical protein n=1 Tax=Bacillus velezensis TaxID=492670 RepID=UPI001BCD7C9F|nr:hypothetical protein [Bacillus velezensis]MBS4742028.1 hypothetical protein [Bacillus velezensis]